MKMKVFRIVFLGLLILNNYSYAQTLSNQEMLNFYPNDIGNEWSYWWVYYSPINDYGEAGRDILKVIKDTTINDKKYFQLNYSYKGSEPEIYYERIDSITGNVYRTEECCLDIEFRVDSLFAQVGDTISIDNNRYLLYSEKMTVLSIRDTVINSLDLTIRKIEGDTKQKLYQAIGIGMLGSGKNYWLDSAKVGGNVYSDISSEITKLTNENNVIETFTLSQNYPNPFNPTTTIEFSIPNGVGTLRATSVRIDIFDILGRKVKTLVNKKHSAGKHKVTFNASNLSSGIYFYRIEADNFFQTKKMMLVK